MAPSIEIYLIYIRSQRVSEVCDSRWGADELEFEAGVRTSSENGPPVFLKRTTGIPIPLIDRYRPLLLKAMTPAPG